MSDSPHKAPEVVSPGHAPSPGLRLGSPLAVSFQSELKAYDRGLKLVWWHKKGAPYHPRWVLYRDTGKGYWIKEYEIVGPNGEYRDLGSWIIRELKRLDMVNIYETEGYDRARALSLQALDRSQAQQEADEDKAHDELALHYAEDLEFARTGRESVVMP